jgi:hypothetical protein
MREDKFKTKIKPEKNWDGFVYLNVFKIQKGIKWELGSRTKIWTV